MTVTIFFTGATGYIGGPILYQLLQKKDAYKITALVRDKQKADKLKEHGVVAVIGSLDDTSVIAEEAYKADVVIHTANADHLGSAKAIVGAFQRKFKETGKKGIYIHTSGSGIVHVSTQGNSASEKIYHDDDTAEVNAIPVTNPHRDVDTFIFENNAAYDLVVIAPSTIYGQGKIFADISNTVSSQIPLAIKGALKAKKPQRIGKGLNIWSNVHVSDVADLFILLLEKLLKGELKDPESQGYYFAENGEHKWGAIHDEIAKILHKKGIASDTSVAEINTEEEIVKAYGFPEAAYYISGNSRIKANKGRKIGWAPKHGGDDVFKSIEADVDYLLSQEKK